MRSLILVGTAAMTELTRSVKWDDVVSDLDVVDTPSDRLYDTTALVAEDDREVTLGVITR
jgi:hypothetical protein